MRVALALGSGGARGYAHIGVIDELKSRGHVITAVAGTSMGSVVGGCEAAGVLGAFDDWVRGLTQRGVWRLLDPSFGGPGAIRAQRVIDRVAELLPETRIEDLGIPYTAVATDLTARREIWFQRGPVALAMRASIAIPSAVTPVMINGRLLADGGLMNPVPMEPLLGSPADLTVAVDLSGPRAADGSRQPVSESAEDPDGSDWLDRVRRGAADVLDSDLVRTVRARVASRPAAELTEEEHPRRLSFGDLPRELRTGDVLALSMDASQALITRFRMAANPPDVTVHVPVDSSGLFDFHRAAELIPLGRRLAADALDRAGY